MGYGLTVTTEQIIGLVAAILVMLCGTAGSVLPVIPGTPLVVGAAVAHRFYFGQQSMSNFVLVTIVVLMLLSLVLDYCATVFGAKKLGATWRGAVGAVIGGLIGLFFNLPGIILGPFIGALLLEMIGGREFKPAARAGLGATLGLLLGGVGKLAICVGIMTLFAVSVVYRST